MKNVLLTGGMGYIGSHTAIELINNKFNVILVDNLSNSSRDVLEKIERITDIKPKFYELDIRDKEGLEKIFKDNKIDSVIHFAGLKAVGESVQDPLRYYDNNMISSITLLETMKKFAVKELVFSSSATVYGDQKSPLDESSQTGVGITNPYGQTKFMIEQIIKGQPIQIRELVKDIVMHSNWNLPIFPTDEGDAIASEFLLEDDEEEV